MSSDGTERPPAPLSGPMRCTRCDCTFKRSEHLKRHERVHDTHKRFACSQCPKLFTRSDILRRHEATHVANEQASGVRPARNRACTECARSRERCTKSEPCQRCSTKGLHCAYPLPRAHGRSQQSHFGPRQNYPQDSAASNRNDSQEAIPRSSGSMANMSAHSIGPGVESRSPIAHNAYAAYNSSEEQMLNFNLSDPMIPEYSGAHIMPSGMDFPMNWLPPDNTMAIDYDSILGLGASSLDFFALPPSSTVDLNLTATMHGGHNENTASVANDQTTALTHRNLRPIAVGEQSPIWTTASSSVLDRNLSSESPHSTAATTSPSAAPGGLYATSVNGARMPCTIRARRATRLIPGGTRIKSVIDERFSDENQNFLDFPDTSHVFVDGFAPRPTSNSRYVTALTSATYDHIQREFENLCLNESCGLLTYASPKFPNLSTLNMFMWLYFENFDDVIPIVHHRVTSLNDHWLLALAVCTIGCHYAEADEFSRSVEPMQEFLRRAIEVEANARQTQSLASTSAQIVLAQAMTLNQIGMLYCGSSRLLRHAKAQHSSLVDMARSLSFPLFLPSNTPAESPLNGESDQHETAWKTLMVEECKRRIGYTIWMLDCMTAYHFAQQPSMPPDLVPVPLPNDKLWHTKSPQEWAMKAVSAHEPSSLSSATVSLFREKEVKSDLGQFSRIILLHSVFREVFYIRDCFGGPLGSWVPSLQQLDHVNLSQKDQGSPATAGGRSLLDSRRNAALDCIDVLHWAANGTIAQAAGAEHPTVLHLHLSRTVILAPLSQIRSFADSIVLLARNPPSRTLNAARQKQIIDAERDILEWAQRDQCKARLAVLHGGCLFWHIRRYSCRAFYEPMSVFLATLTIWAYSSYASRIAEPYQRPSTRSAYSTHEGKAPASFASGDLPGSQSPDSIPSPASPASDEGEPAPTFIHLDRPNDDEMVQSFVRFGTSARMRANITGVGNIYSAKGPARILREGRKILATVSTAWGRTEAYANVLGTLEQVASGRMALNAA